MSIAGYMIAATYSQHTKQLLTSMQASAKDLKERHDSRKVSFESWSCSGAGTHLGQRQVQVRLQVTPTATPQALPY